MRLERSGSERWLHTSASPEQLWRAFEAVEADQVKGHGGSQLADLVNPTVFKMLQDQDGLGYRDYQYKVNEVKAAAQSITGFKAVDQKIFFREGIIPRLRIEISPPELAKLNKDIYVPMQGPSEMGASGKLEQWDRSRDLGRIAAPTLVIGAQYDTMDPKHMEWMSKQIPHGTFLLCPNGSHLAIVDDQQAYMTGLIAWLHDLEAGRLAH